MSDSLWPHETQHTRPPCPSQAPGVYPNSCPLSQWCHPTILSSVRPFSSCLQSFPASEYFLMSQLFISGGQSIGALVSVLPVNNQDWFPLGLTDFISLQRTTEDEKVGWHHWLSGHEFEQASRVGDGQGSLACCSPWGHKELDMTERMNNSNTALFSYVFTWYVLSPNLDFLKKFIYLFICDCAGSSLLCAGFL